MRIAEDDDDDEDDIEQLCAIGRRKARGRPFRSSCRGRGRFAVRQSG